MTFAIGVVSQFIESSKRDHWEAMAYFKISQESSWKWIVV